MYKEVKLYWHSVDFKRILKVGEVAVGCLFQAAMILTNVRNCLYLNQVSQYFECGPPNPLAFPAHRAPEVWYHFLAEMKRFIMSLKFSNSSWSWASFSSLSFVWSYSSLTTRWSLFIFHQLLASQRLWCSTSSLSFSISTCEDLARWTIFPNRSTSPENLSVLVAMRRPHWRLKRSVILLSVSSASFESSLAYPKTEDPDWRGWHTVGWVRDSGGVRVA